MISTEVIAMETKAGIEPKKRNMLVPILTMIIMMPIGLYITGRPEILGKSEAMELSLFNILGEGSGSTAVFWAVIGSITIAGLMYLTQRILSLHEIMDLSLKGAGGLMPMAVIMMLAFALNETCGKENLNTGAYVADLATVVPLDLNLPLVVSAILGGGVFGDHCSPISDTSVISSLATASDHIDHVKTQLPYALTAASVALVGYLFAGFIFS